MAITDRIGRTVGTDQPNDAETNPQAALAIKTPVRACTTANIVLNGTITVDGVALAAGDRVLVRNQSDTTQNGIYTVSSGNWTRTVDFDQLGEMVKGTQVYINEGTANGAKTSYVTASDPITPDTTALTFSAPTAGIIASNGITLTGNTLTAHIGSGLEFSGGAIKATDGIIAAGASTVLAFDTRTAAIAATIPSTVNYISTAGYSAIGDGGGSIATNAVYKRVGSLPAHSGYIHSADGTYWELIGPLVSVKQFGAVAAVANLDTDPDAAAAINLCMAYCNLKQVNMRIPAGQWPLDSAITSPTFIIQISGEQGGGQPTVLYKRYVEADVNKGIISLGAWGATITDIQMAAKTGASGGSGLSAILPNNAANIGVLRLRNIYVSCGDGVNTSLHINGIANTGGSGGTGGKSYRSVFLENCSFFGAAQYCVVLLSVQHCFAVNGFTDTTGGTMSSGVVLNCAGNATSVNDDIYWTGIIGGLLNLDYTSRAVFNCVVQGNVNNTANVTTTTVMRGIGTVQANWTSSRAIN